MLLLVLHPIDLHLLEIFQRQVTLLKDGPCVLELELDLLPELMIIDISPYLLVDVLQLSDFLLQRPQLGLDLFLEIFG